MISIYTPEMKKVGVITKYESLIFARSFYNVEGFEMYINKNEAYTEELKEFNIIQVGDRKDKAGIITHRSLPLNESGQSGEILFIKGIELKGLVGWSIIPDTNYQSFSGTQESIMKEFVNKNMINADDPERNISNLALSINKGLGKEDKWRGRLENLGEKLQEIATFSSLGWDILFDYKNKKLVFDVFQGVDRTIDNKARSPVIFEQQYGNILSREYTTDITNSANVIYIGGVGEHEKKLIQKTGNEKGFRRIEAYQDYSSITDISELKEKAEQVKKDMEQAENFTILASPGGSFKYGKDYFLGDYVTIIDRDLNIQRNTQIVAIKEINEGLQGLEITFGKMMPTVFSKISKGERSRPFDIPKELSGPIAPVERGEKGDPGQDGKDGANGIDGSDGKNLEYNWNGTELGIRVQGESSYVYRNLIGPIGKQGIQGLPGKDGVNGIQGLPGKDGTDANVTKDKVISVLGYIPLQTLDLKHIETSIANLEHSKASKVELNSIKNNLEKSVSLIDVDIVKLKSEKASKEELQDVSEAINRNIPVKVSQLTNDRNFLNDMLSYAKVKDTRNKVDIPSDFQSGEGQKAHFEFKSITSADNPPVQAHRTYVYVLTFAGWRDASGGYPVQLAFGENGLATRIGISQDTWSSWEKVADIKDIPSTIAWNNISNKPTSFNPSEHKHSWTSIEDKPTTFNPSSHNHDNYALKTALEEVERRLNNLDIPEGVDLTPVYEEIDRVKNTNHFESKNVGSKSFDYMKEPGIFRIYHTTTSPNRTNQDYMLYVSKYNSNILQIAFLLESNREDLGKMYVRTFTGGQFSSWTNMNDKPAETIVIEDSGVKYKAKYVMKNNIPHLEVLERL